MSRDTEVELLTKAVDDYASWAELHTTLRESVKKAEDLHEVPLENLLAEFRALVQSLRSFVAFAVACPPDGPETDGLIGQAFVISLVRAGQAPDVPRAIDEYASQTETWLRDSYAGDRRRRPQPPAAVLAVRSAMTEYRNHVDERELETIFDGFAEAATKRGHQTRESFTAFEGGGFARTLTIGFPAEAPDHLNVVDKTPLYDSYPAETIGVRIRDFFTRRSYLLVRRDRNQQPNPTATWKSFWSRTKALAMVQQLRTELDANEVVDLFRNEVAGPCLIDVLPPLDPRTTHDNGEIVFGHPAPSPDFTSSDEDASLIPVGFVYPMGPEWGIEVLARGTGTLIKLKFKQAVHASHREAVAAVYGIYAAHNNVS